MISLLPQSLQNFTNAYKSPIAKLLQQMNRAVAATRARTVDSELGSILRFKRDSKRTESEIVWTTCKPESFHSSEAERVPACREGRTEG